MGSAPLAECGEGTPHNVCEEIPTNDKVIDTGDEINETDGGSNADNSKTEENEDDREKKVFNYVK